MDAALATRDSAHASTAAALNAALSELEASRSRIIQLELVADRLSGSVVARDDELRRLRAQLDALRGEGERGLRALAAVAEELDAVRSQARGQATRMRMLALREAAELSESVAELTRGPAETRERLVDSLEEVLGRISTADSLREIETSGAGEEIRIARTTPPPQPDDQAPLSPPAAFAPEPRTPNAVAARIAEDVFVGSIEIEIGPLSDFAQLVAFEDAVGAIPVVGEVAVKRFAQGRAILAARLTEPVELLRELADRAPFEFDIRELDADHVVLDVAG